ncbi:MAG: methylcobalamin:coenzyme M methyltransferase [Firmicutes bacterium ADurb.Bin300]|jgi:uroporphyrinogen decarboxylase|nr:MAG: methylcobalamin:coenzyme M methyltransferase [Firmicutes bacterium ADurb.Bin300]
MIVVSEKQRFIKALKREPIKGHVPTFELVFFLTLEAVGKVHPDHRRYSQWNQMSEKEKRLQLTDMADSYIDVAKKYGHSAIFVHPNPNDFENIVRILETIRERSGDEYFLMLHGDPTFSMPDGKNMTEFTRRLYEDGEALKHEARAKLEMRLDFAERMLKYPGLLDGFALCSDYCFNVNPFFTPEMFSEFIAPYLQEVLEGYRSMGYYSIKHTDGNIMPIADQMVQCKPDALHSLDPQGGVDLKEMRRLYSDKVCLIGNVNCGLLQTGTREECEADVRRSLRDGMAGYGYIFSTSNCAYTGLSLDRYELMNRIWREEGIYK